MRINQHKPVLISGRFREELLFNRTIFCEGLRCQLSNHVQRLLSSKHDQNFTVHDRNMLVATIVHIRTTIRAVTPFTARFPYRKFHRQCGHMRKAHRTQTRVLKKHGGFDEMNGSFVDQFAQVVTA